MICKKQPHAKENKFESYGTVTLKSTVLSITAGTRAGIREQARRVTDWGGGRWQS